jgi:hypothetical protein
VRLTSIRHFDGGARPALESPVTANSSEVLQLHDSVCHSVRIS